MRKLFTFLILFLAVQGMLLAQATLRVQQSINRFVEDTAFRHTNIGIHAISMRTGKVLGTYEAEESMATASVLKILSTATALAQRGADFRYQTPVNYTGSLKAGTLHGHLVIQGVGDPTFNSKHFPENDAVNTVVTLLKAKGIQYIAGDILLDNSSFVSRVPPTWTWEDIGNYYGATLSAINYSDNLYRLSFRTGTAGTKAKILSILPQQNFIVQNEVLASKINADRAYIFGAPQSNKRIVRGTLPQNRKSFTIKGAMPQPELTFGQAVQKALQRAGIKVSGKVKIASCTAPKVRIGAIYSPKLREIIKETNFKSINLFAEAMLYLVQGAKAQNQEALLEAMLVFWKAKGIDVSGLYLHDGSGLSHFNAANPSFFTTLLRYMAKTPQAKCFQESLPVSGVSGTLKYLGKGTALTGKIHGKSGSMGQVCCYVGYLTTQSGEQVAFAIMLNNFQGYTSSIRKKIAKMLLEW